MFGESPVLHFHRSMFTINGLFLLSMISCVSFLSFLSFQDPEFFSIFVIFVDNDYVYKSKLVTVETVA